jgi:hypothetical protein
MAHTDHKDHTLREYLQRSLPDHDYILRDDPDLTEEDALCRDDVEQDELAWSDQAAQDEFIESAMD